MSMIRKYHNHTMQTNPRHRHVPAHEYDVICVSHHLKGNMWRNLSKLFINLAFRYIGNIIYTWYEFTIVLQWVSFSILMSEIITGEKWFLLKSYIIYRIIHCVSHDIKNLSLSFGGIGINNSLWWTRCLCLLIQAFLTDLTHYINTMYYSL